MPQDQGKERRTVKLPKQCFDVIVSLAEREYPFECCGFIIGDGSAHHVRPVRNIQNERHAADPVTFPRDARTAYLMDPAEVVQIMEEVDRHSLRVTFIFHSHPDHDAYFSETDRRAACAFDPDEPDYPDAAQIVLSVRQGRFARAAAFVWDLKQRDFVEAELVVE